MGQSQKFEDADGRIDQPAHCNCFSEPHLHESLRYVRRAAPWYRPSIICIGGATTRVVDELLAHGYLDLTVVDTSADAIQAAQLRLGTLAKFVAWRATDVLTANFSRANYQIWHDGVVYRSLMTSAERVRYASQMAGALKPGGFAIVTTFDSDPAQLAEQEAARFRRIEFTVLEPDGSFGCERRLAYSFWRREAVVARRGERAIA